MCDYDIIKHCSPTLAGMKCGSMFSVLHESKEELWEDLKNLNKMFSKRGLCMIPLRTEGDHTLMYLYRPAQLSACLSKPEAAKLLQEKGYPCGQTARSLVCLIKHLRQDKQFPHEIGLFLDYPAEDVRGFMEGQAQSKCVGTYRVYGDEKAAAKTFAKYKKCQKIYDKVFKEGRSLEQLTVASRGVQCAEF